MVGLYAGVSQLARESGSYPECHWFESDRRYQRNLQGIVTLQVFLLCTRSVTAKEKVAASCRFRDFEERCPTTTMPWAFQAEGYRGGFRQAGCAIYIFAASYFVRLFICARDNTPYCDDMI